MRKKKCKYGYPECVFDSVKYDCDHCYNTDIGSHMNKQTITYLRKCLRPLKEEQRLCLKAKEKKSCEHDCRATKMCPRYSVIKDLKELIDTEWEKIKKRKEKKKMMESEEIKSTFIGTLEEELNKKQRELDELDNAYRAEKRRDKLISYLIIFWNYTMVKACETVAQLDDRFVENMVDMFNNKKYMEDRLTELKNDIQVCNSALNALKYHDHLCGHNVSSDPCCACGDCDGDSRRY